MTRRAEVCILLPMHHIAIPVITLGVYVLRRVVKRLPPKFLPWVSALCGVLTAGLTGVGVAGEAAG